MAHLPDDLNLLFIVSDPPERYHTAIRLQKMIRLLRLVEAVLPANVRE